MHAVLMALRKQFKVTLLEKLLNEGCKKKYENKNHTGVALKVKQRLKRSEDPDQDNNLKGSKQ